MCSVALLALASSASAAVRTIAPAAEGGVSEAERGRFTRTPDPYITVGQPGPAPYRFQGIYRFPIGGVEQAPRRAEFEFWYVHQTPAVPRPAFLRVEHVADGHAGVEITQSNEAAPHPDAIAAGETIKNIRLTPDREANRRQVIDVTQAIANDLDAGRKAATFRIRLVDAEGETIRTGGAAVQLFSHADRTREDGTALTGAPRLRVESHETSAKLIAPGLAARNAEGELRLIHDGRPVFGVDLRVDRSPLIDFALESLDQAVEALTGEAPARTAEAPVRLVLRVDPPGSDASPEADQNYAIRTADDTIRITAASEPALLWAVTDFAERALGATWPDPGPAHVAGPVETLAIAPLDVTDTPGMPYRGLHINGSHDGPQFHRATIDWMARNGMNIKTTHPFHFPRVYEWLINRGIQPNTNAHSYFWLVPPELADTHPEFFPIVDGERYVFEGHGGVGTQLNVSAEGLPGHIADRARQLFKRYPAVETFGVWPNDGNRGWSESSGDRRIDGALRGKTWEGKPIYTNRVVYLANEVAKLIAEDYPAKLIGTGAYATFREPPTIGVEPNVRIDFTTMGRNYLHPLTDPNDPKNAEVLRQLKGWLDQAQHVRIYEYYSSGGLGIGYLPMPAWRAICADVADLAELGVEGMYSENHPKPSNRPALALTQYVFARALWSPGVEFEAVLADFCNASYGPGGEAMQRFFLAYERAIREGVDHVGYRTPITPLLDALRGEPVREMEAALTEAERLVQRNGTERHAESLGLQRSLMRKIQLALNDPRDLDFVGENLLHNPGIEQDDYNAPGWDRGVVRGRYDFAVDNHVSHAGQRSLRIVSRQPGWGRWIQRIHTDPGEDYLFSVWYRATQEFDGYVWAHQGKHHTAGQLVRIGPTDGQWKQIVLPPLEAMGTNITLFLESRDGGTVHFDDAFVGRILQEK